VFIRCVSAPSARVQHKGERKDWIAKKKFVAHQEVCCAPRSEKKVCCAPRSEKKVCCAPRSEKKVCCAPRSEKKVCCAPRSTSTIPRSSQSCESHSGVLTLPTDPVEKRKKGAGNGTQTHTKQKSEDKKRMPKASEEKKREAKTSDDEKRTSKGSEGWFPCTGNRADPRRIQA